VVRTARPAALLAALSVAAGAACYSSSDPGADPATTTAPARGDDAGAVTSTPAASAFVLGQGLVQTYACTTCHGADLSGNIEQDSGVYSANITPDINTGIGSWTLANLTSALRDGIDDQGEMICAAMPKFPSLTDDDILDMYAYLQGIPAVSKAQTGTDCAGNPESGDDDDDDDAGGTDAGDDAATTPDADTDSGTDASDPCPHKVCVEGAPLSPSCGGCATAVCKHDPSCCETSWGATCRTEVNLYCVTQCN
jgi:cytochrome c553